MSFETLKVSELKEVAESFGVAIEGLKNKADIIAALSEEGVTWLIYKKTLGIQEEEVEDTTEEIINNSTVIDDPDNTVLVKMERANFRYDVMGFTFTREHPYIAMNKNKAQAIFDKEEGFRLATPKEVQEFYN